MPTRRKAFVAELYHHVPVLDSGARGSTITFAQRGIGDVLLAWENEAHLALKESGPASIEIVYPSVSILAEPPVALVDKNVDRHGTRKVAEAYPEFLYTPGGAGDRGEEFLSPARSGRSLAAHAAEFPNIPLVTIDGDFGGWAKAQATHFADGGVFDQIYKPRQMSRRAAASRRSRDWREAASASARLRPVAGLHAVLSVRDRADPAGGAGAAAVVAGLGRFLGGDLPRRACWPRCALSFGMAAVAAAINAVFGLIIAWVLVRYAFPAGACSTRWSICRSPCRPRWPASR